MDDQDFSQLPLEEKIAHKVWKVRLDGYTSLIDEFSRSRNSQDSCFALFNLRPDTFKAIVTDSNVVAQETGIAALCSFLEYGGTSQNALKLKNAGVISSLCEKGLASARAGTKTKTVEAILTFVELLNSADPVLEQIVPFFDNRLPKLVAGCTNAAAQIFETYGCIVASPKIIIPCLTKLFGHADKNVRAEATKLAVEIYKWMGDGLGTILLPTLKPVQQRDLAAEFDKVKGTKPEQKRMTRAQQEELAQQQEKGTEPEDVEMEEVLDAPAFDPFDLLDPVDVLSKMPNDLNSRMASVKWKDRKEALDEVYEILLKAPKLADGDYGDLVRIFSKCMKDANIQVVQLAANGTEFLCKGLKGSFHRYQNAMIGPMIERSKEKKPAVADALANALDSIYLNSSLGTVLDETINGMKHKTPQVKISSTNYLQRCLATATVPPKSAQIDAIMEAGVKLLSDSQEPIRQAATEMIGTLMKITGERELNSFLDKIDENRMSKVRAVFETAEVKCTLASKPPSGRAPPSNRLPTAAASSRIGAVPSLKKPAAQSIPTKRTATSPAKRAETTSKATSVRSLTGRLLISPSLGSQVKEVASAEREELVALKLEKAQLIAQNELLRSAQYSLSEDLLRNQKEVEELKSQIEILRKDNSTGSLMVKQKDTQILRLSSDLENAKLKIKSLEQTIEMMKLQQSTLQADSFQPFYVDSRSPYRSPERAQSRISLTELSSRVNRLSIEGGLSAPDPETLGSPRKAVSDATNVYHAGNKEVSEEENWRKAAEVTAQLKARIEKMKQRNRLSLNR